MTRLEGIETRQRRSLLRDVVFATLVVIAGAVSLGSVGVAAHAAQVAKR